MKTKIITLFFMVFASTTFAQGTSDIPIQNISTDSDVNYRLFSTRNIFTFIKLDTRNGKMWQVQWSTGGDKFQVPLSLTSLVSSEEERIGRFFLYPTSNIYNFILLDQIDGRTWQVQWHIDVENRLVMPIN